MKLHLFNDEKIVNRTIDMFEEVFPGENLFVVANKRGNFKWVKRRDCVLSRTEFLKQKRDCPFNEIYIHSLNRRKMNLVNRLELNGARVYWIIWGFDLYNRLLAPKGFRMMDPTTSFYKYNNGGWKKLWRPFQRWQKKRKAEQTIRFIRKKVDYIVTDTTDNDYQYLLKYYPELNVKPWKDFFYYPLDVILGPSLMESHVSGQDIMIGNSASATNNHEYVMHILSKLNIGMRKVVVPLSYSVKKRYVESVMRTGNDLFGNHFTPLLKFMPLEDYNRLQASIGIALFGNWRQEAIGNIIVALYLGAKVFLSSVNPVYEWAQSHGLTVFELEKISQTDIDTPLEESLRSKNRKILTSLYTKERMHRLMKELAE